MHRDFEPYYVRVGDSWTRIDYSASADSWMKPLVRGHETDLVEIPANWYLDDLPPMMFIKSSPNSHGFVNPRDIEQMWRDQFDWVHREMDYAAFTMTIHPDVSGRPQVLLALERLVEHINGHDGVRWATFDAIADDFLNRSPRTGREAAAGATPGPGKVGAEQARKRPGPAPPRSRRSVRRTTPCDGLHGTRVAAVLGKIAVEQFVLRALG